MRPECLPTPARHSVHAEPVPRSKDRRCVQVPETRLAGEGKKSEKGGRQEVKKSEEDGGQDGAPPLWAAPSGYATHVKTVEVEFKELEFIDPSRMVRLFGVEWEAVADVATSAASGLFTSRADVDDVPHQVHGAAEQVWL